jgi:hypothetical protein
MNASNARIRLAWSAVLVLGWTGICAASEPSVQQSF